MLYSCANVATVDVIGLKVMLQVFSVLK